MSRTWVTADQHFGHARIIELCNRPFKDVHHMDEELTRRWNECVQPNDVVYVVGDFTLGRRAEWYAARLNGYISFLPGSHDKWMLEAISRHEGDFWKLFGFLGHIHDKLRVDGHKVVLCHYAMRSWPGSFHGSVLLYGHSHGRMPQYGRSMDIGVDTNDFYPYDLEATVRYLLSQPTHVQAGEPD
jgi:calcineurin-like phosphoesterase family protein